MKTTLSSPWRTPGSPLSPFRYRAFAVIWAAAVASNIGIWMQSAAAGWLMTDLDPDPRVVAMVQVATALPMFLFGLPAGALADIVNRRRLLLVTEIAATVLTALFAALVSLGRATETNLLVFIVLYGVASALMAPAYQAILPQLVDSPDLPPAIALDSLAVNISRAIGPALVGLFIAYLGMAAPFWFNVLANLGIIAALIWWRDREVLQSRLPPEPFGSAIRMGLRYARHNRHLRATS
jgi:MFS family permease